MIDDVLEYFNKLYPNEMVTHEMNVFGRVKLAGKVELLQEIARFLEDEYGSKLGSN